MRISKFGFAAATFLFVAGAASSVSAMGTEDYLGSVGLFAGNFCPRGTLPAEGQLQSVNDHAPLFSLLGVAYGGNGQTTFALPDLRGKEPLPGLRYCIAVTGVYPSRD